MAEITELKKKQAELERESTILKEELALNNAKTTKTILRMSLEEVSKHRKQEVPPPVGEITLIFTDVQGSTEQVLISI